MQKHSRNIQLCCYWRFLSVWHALPVILQVQSHSLPSVPTTTRHPKMQDLLDFIGRRHQIGHRDPDRAWVSTPMLRGILAFVRRETCEKHQHQAHGSPTHPLWNCQREEFDATIGNHLAPLSLILRSVPHVECKKQYNSAAMNQLPRCPAPDLSQDRCRQQRREADLCTAV